MSIIYTMPDLDIVLYEASDITMPATACLEHLRTSLDWRTETITMFGKTILQPRMIAFYSDPGLSYRYSRRTFQGQPWTPVLAELRNLAEQLAHSPLNSVLANLYRDQHDSMGMHADDEPELGINPVIVSMSFGETRRFVLQHKTRKDVPRLELNLEDSSILVMRGATQHHWIHGIKKETRPRGPRVNLTFRHILTS
jgi:alkylated DNA repair dioxygenase AlkB